MYFISEVDSFLCFDDVKTVDVTRMFFCGRKFHACPVVRDALKVINKNCFRDKTDDKILPRILLCFQKYDSIALAGRKLCSQEEKIELCINR